MLSYQSKDFDTDILGLSKDNSVLFEFDLDINKIKTFKNLKGKKSKYSNGGHHVKNIPSTEPFYLEDHLNFDNKLNINTEIHEINMGFILSDTLSGQKSGYLIPYICVDNDEPIYMNIRVSLLKNNVLHNSCFVSIEEENNGEHLYTCFDYLKLDEYDDWLVNGKLPVMITILNVSDSYSGFETSKYILDELHNFTAYYEDQSNSALSDSEITSNIKKIDEGIKNISNEQLQDLIDNKDNVEKILDILKILMKNNPYSLGYIYKFIQNIESVDMNTSFIETHQNMDMDKLKKIQSVLELLTSVNNEVITDKMIKEKEDEKLLCQICCSEKINTVFVPCGHMICCEECSKSVFKTYNYDDWEEDLVEENSNDCPLCKEEVDSVQKIYMN